MNVFQKIMSLFLSSLILFSTTSFVVDEHYCGEMLADISITGRAASCACEDYKSSEEHSGFNLENDSCCSNKITFHDNNDELNKVSFELSFENTLFLHTYFYSYINLFEGLENNIVPFKNYSPPLIVTNIHVVYESFLI